MSNLSLEGVSGRVPSAMLVGELPTPQHSYCRSGEVVLFRHQESSYTSDVA